MAHASLKDRLSWSIWITGAPGCGFNTVGSKLGGYMTDQIGFRSTHKAHKEWKISLDCLKYRITDPEATNPYFYGFGQNYVDVAKLPWKKIVFMRVSRDLFIERVVKYRRSNNIVDGVADEVMGLDLYRLQENIAPKLRGAANCPFSEISGDPSPEAIIREYFRVKT